MLIFLAATFNMFTTICHTVAYQSDTSGFIVLMANVTVVFFFLCDTLVFDEAFTKVELTGILVILTVVIFVAVFKLKDKNQAKTK